MDLKQRWQKIKRDVPLLYIPAPQISHQLSINITEQPNNKSSSASAWPTLHKRQKSGEEKQRIKIRVTVSSTREILPLADHVQYLASLKYTEL